MAAARTITATLSPANRALGLKVGSSIKSRLWLTASRSGRRFAASCTLQKIFCIPVPGHPIWIGADFGRSPAVLFGQAVNNRVIVLDEMQGHNVSAVTFAPQVKRRLEQKYPGFTFVAYGDPKGRDKTQSDERTAYDIFRSHGIDMKPAPVKMNLIETRITAVDYLLGQLYDGRPRLQISPNCRTLIAGMEGGYCYERKLRSSEIKTEPAKNRFSHFADALEYLALAMGEGRASRRRNRTPGRSQIRA